MDERAISRTRSSCSLTPACLTTKQSRRRALKVNGGCVQLVPSRE